MEDWGGDVCEGTHGWLRRVGGVTWIVRSFGLEMGITIWVHIERPRGFLVLSGDGRWG
jgi:hypothetical protein